MDKTEQKSYFLKLLPLVTLYQPAFLAVQGAAAIGHTWQVIRSAHQDPSKENLLECGKESAKLALLIICPLALGVLFHGSKVMDHGRESLTLLIHGQWSEGISSLGATGLEVLHIVTFVGGPYIMAALLAIHAVIELRKAYETEDNVERGVQALLGLAKIYQLHQLNCRYNHFLTSFSEPIPILRGISSIPLRENAIYEECDFSDQAHPDLALKNVTFRNCKFENFFVKTGEIHNSSFHHCNLTQATFNETKITHTLFNHCNAFRADFLGSIFHKTLFQNCNLQEASFFDTQATLSSLFDCDLTNALLSPETFKTNTTHRMTKTVIAIGRTYDISSHFEHQILTAATENETDSVVLHYPIDASSPSLAARVAAQADAIRLVGQTASAAQDAFDHSLIQEAKAHSLPIEALQDRVHLVGDYDRVTVLKPANFTIHAILAGDTDTDDHTASATKISSSLMEKMAQKVAAVSSARLNSQSFLNKHANSDEIIRQIERLKVNKEDTLIAHFLFHGVRTTDKTNKWPYMGFPGNWYYGQRPLIDFQTFVDHLKAKKPRLLFAMTESCNGYANQPTPPLKSAPGGKLTLLMEYLRHEQRKNEIQSRPCSQMADLFTKAKGSIVLSASSPGQFSMMFPDHMGGFLTHEFFCRLVELSRPTTWSAFLDEVKQAVTQKTWQIANNPQTPQWDLDLAAA